MTGKFSHILIDRSKTQAGRARHSVRAVRDVGSSFLRKRSDAPYLRFQNSFAAVLAEMATSTANDNHQQQELPENKPAFEIKDE